MKNAINAAPHIHPALQLAVATAIAAIAPLGVRVRFDRAMSAITMLRKRPVKARIPKEEDAKIAVSRSPA
jgi:hypothetical protein